VVQTTDLGGRAAKATAKGELQNAVSPVSAAHPGQI
jgi:hypothetical protein